MKHTGYRSFADILKAERRRRGWSQVYVAEQLGTDFRVVSRWERGLHLPTAFHRPRLCALFEMSLEELGLLTTALHGMILLCAAPEDAALASHLKEELLQRGIALWHDEILLLATAEQHTTLREACQVVSAVVLLATPATATIPYIQDAMTLVERQNCPLLVFWRMGKRRCEALPAQQEIVRLLDMLDGRESRYAQAIEKLIERLTTLSASADDDPGSLPARVLRNPYKGLRAFTEDDACDFFGRDRLIRRVLNDLEMLLTAPEPAGRVLAMIGPSGSGKSSLLRAGVLPLLRLGEVEGSEAWAYLPPLVPGRHPLEALTAAFGCILPHRSLSSIRSDLEDEAGHGLHLLAMQSSQYSQKRVLVLIDQCEELFTQTLDEQERKQFLKLLVQACTLPRGPVVVLLTLRADFLDRLIGYPDFARLVEQHAMLVFPLQLQEVQAVIEQPVRQKDVLLHIEERLTMDLIAETQGQPGALPLLEFTLEQLYERRDGRTLTWQAYQQLGGLSRALAQRAESTYASLPSEHHRSLARALFLRLIEPGLTEQETTRRRITPAEIIPPDAKQATIMRTVVESFVAARLLVTSGVAGTATIEVGHEALIREWARLADWLHEACDDIRLQQAISRDSLEWERHKKSKDRLYHGSQLREARAWARRNTPNSHEIAFLQASTAWRRGSLIRILVVLLLLISGTGLTSWFFLRPADPTYVTNAQDNGVGSLRWAIANAPAKSTITLANTLSGKTIRLTGGELDIVREIALQGPASGQVTISSPSGYPLRIHARVTFSHFLFSQSRLPSTSGFIYNEGSLVLRESSISDNTGGQGGGIYNAGVLTLINSVVSHNRASVSSGGGIFNIGTLTLINSTVSHNTSTQGSGGGIYNSGLLLLTNSTVSNNTAGTRGGGIFSYGILKITNSTIAENQVMRNASTGNHTTDDEGGGIAMEGGRTDITFGTIYGNTSSSGGGISNEISPFTEKPGLLLLRNSLVAENKAASSGPDIKGALISGGYNLIGHISGITFSGAQTMPSDIFGENFSRLGIDPVLRDNGGLATPHTLTHALLPGSPALNKIPPTACQIKDIFYDQSRTYIDQRGVKRPQGSACDIGSYEYGS